MTFAKLLRRFEILVSDEHLKLILLRLDCYNIQIGCVNFMKFLKQSYRYKDEIEIHSGRFKLEKGQAIDYSPEKVKMRALSLIQASVKRFLERQ